MTELNESLGSITHTGSQYTAELKRYLEHDVSSVWAILTEPGKFVDWLAPGEIELKTGGRAKINFVDSGIVIDSEVTQCTVPNVLEYSWSSPGEPDRPVRYELADNAGTVELTITLTAPDDEDIARSCAGWEAHLMMLIAALEGVPINFPFQRFQDTRGAYNEMVAAL